MTDGRQPSAGCLDPETLAAFIDDRLEPRERAAVEAHLTECEDCYEVWMEARVIAESLAGTEASKVAQRGGRFAYRLTWAASIAAILVLAIWTYRSFQTRSERPEIRELVTAIASARPIEARLTGGFAWGPIPAATRSATQSRTSPAVTIAAAQLQQRLDQQRTAETLAGFASGQMALATAQSLDAAISALKEATALKPDNPYYWSDLAAALYSRYQASPQPIDLPEALEAVESAIGLKPDLPEARFNRALLLEKLSPADRAVQAWREYLALDSTTAWATEARQHIQRLERGAQEARDRPSPAALRDRLFDTILAEWAVADRNRQSQILAEADEVNQSLSQYGDLLASDALEALRHGSPGQRNWLEAGHQAYGRARAAYIVDNFAEAEKEFLVAAEALARAGSPLALSAGTFIAAIEYLDRRFDAAARRLSDIRQQIGERRYPTLIARHHWLLGLIVLIQGDYSASEHHYTAAAAIYKQIHEQENYAFMQVLLAERLEFSGDVNQAWAVRMTALPIDRRNGALLEAAKAARGSGFAHTALLFEVEAVERARNGTKPLDLADALRNLAISRADAGNHGEAFELIAETRSILSAGDSKWDRMRAEVDLTEGLAADGARAVEALDRVERSLDFFTNAQADGRLPEILLTRARLNRLLQRLEPARTDLRRTRELLDRQLATVTDRQLRAVFGNQLARLGDEWISVEAAAGDYVAAWEAAELSRTWLPSQSPTVRVDPLSLSQARAKLPDRAVALYFALTGQELHLWSVGRTTFDHRVVPASRASVERLVEAFRSSNASPAVGIELRRLLIDPIPHVLDNADTVVIVPDGPLHLVPFSALPGSRTRFLVEEHAVVVAQSLAMALRPAARADNRWDVTSIGNPTLDRARHPTLADLPNAEIEARMVARQYGDRGQVLAGAAATVQTVRAAMPASHVIHFASHAVVNRRNPGLSALLLTGDSAITADEVAGLPLNRTRLVVLAACQSADGQLTRNGPLGLANAFLRAGVSSVIAGYWVVDDSASLELFRTFYTHYRQTGSQVDALR